MDTYNDPNQDELNKLLQSIGEQASNVPPGVNETLQSAVDLLTKQTGVSQSDIQTYLDANVGGKHSPITGGFVIAILARKS